MSPDLATLRIIVEPSPETHDHVVRLFAGGDDLIRRFSSGLIGLDPDDLLVEPCLLHAVDVPRGVTIARCECGIVGCDSVEVSIERQGDTVLWRDQHSRVAVRFDFPSYEAEIHRALSDFSWETPARTAARLIAQSLDRERLAEFGLEYRWAWSGSLDEGMTVAFALHPGPYQILVRFQGPFSDPEAIAGAVVRRLAGEPATWPDVEWHSQAADLASPSIAGRGWREGTA